MLKTSGYQIAMYELLKQQMTVTNVTDFFDLDSAIQLNCISSKFEEQDQMYTCLHPIGNLTREKSFVLFNIVKCSVIKSVNDITDDVDIDNLLLSNGAIKLDYVYYAYETGLSVNMSVYLDCCVKSFKVDRIEEIMNNLFGLGRFSFVDVSRIIKEVSAKDILDKVTKPLEFEMISMDNVIMYKSTVHEHPYLKVAYVSEDKSVTCLFKEQILDAEELDVKSKTQGTSFTLRKDINQLYDHATESFNSVIIESVEMVDGNLTIYKFCVNIHGVIIDKVSVMLSAIMRYYGLYSYSKLTVKKLSYIDVI